MKYTIFILALLANITLLAQPSECNGDYFLSVGFNGTSGFYKVNISPINNEITFSPLNAGGTDFFVNSVGFRSTDNFIYGLTIDNELCRINAAGEVSIIASITNLNPDLGYYAGDVSPDGQFLFLLGTHLETATTTGLARINLNDYSAETINLPDDYSLSIADLVFDPATNEVYAFDGSSKRLIKVNPNSGTVDQTLYPPTEAAAAIAAIFIDAFGDLYGYGRRPGEDFSDTFFKINKSTGEITAEAFGPLAGAMDACSCPYSVEIQKSVFPTIALPCDEVTYVFKIANGSSFSQIGLDFLDEMPEDLIITEIVRNPFDGDLVSGVGTNVLSIENFTLPQGVDSIIIRAYVPETASGIYKNQAKITNLSEGLGEETLSDDPSTIATEDSTCLFVPEFSAAIGMNGGLCPGDTLLLQAMDYPTASYEWSNGSTESSTLVTSTGWYFLKVTSNCQSLTDSIYVYPSEFEIDLGPDLSIELGDSI